MLSHAVSPFPINQINFCFPAGGTVFAFAYINPRYLSDMLSLDLHSLNSFCLQPQSGKIFDSVPAGRFIWHTAHNPGDIPQLAYHNQDTAVGGKYPVQSGDPLC